MLDTKLSINQIEQMLVNRHGGFLRVLAVPNVSYGLIGYEADLIICTRSGYATEYEIKRSWQDFKNDFKKKHPHEHMAICVYYFAYVVPKKIEDKVLEFMKDRFTDYDMPKVLTYDDDGIMSELCGNFHPKIRDIKGCRKMTNEEIFKLARLGCIRYWTRQNNHNLKI